MKTYRDTVIESLNLLENVRDHLFTQIVNISAEGELRDVLNVFEEGEAYTFEMDQFENSKDINVQKLLGLCKEIELVYNSIHNVNAVTKDEIYSLAR